MRMWKRLTLPLLLAALFFLAACSGDKGPEAEVKAAENAIAAAKAAQVDPANPDLKAAEDAFAKAEAEINWQKMNATVKDYKAAKELLVLAKSLSEKALADHKAAASGTPKTKDRKDITKSDPPRIKS